MGNDEGHNPKHRESTKPSSARLSTARRAAHLCSVKRGRQATNRKDVGHSSKHKASRKPSSTLLSASRRAAAGYSFFFSQQQHPAATRANTTRRRQRTTPNTRKSSTKHTQQPRNAHSIESVRMLVHMFSLNRNVQSHFPDTAREQP